MTFRFTLTLLLFTLVLRLTLVFRFAFVVLRLALVLRFVFVFRFAVLRLVVPRLAPPPRCFEIELSLGKAPAAGVEAKARAPASASSGKAWDTLMARLLEGRVAVAALVGACGGASLSGHMWRERRGFVPKPQAEARNGKSQVDRDPVGDRAEAPRPQTLREERLPSRRASAHQPAASSACPSTAWTPEAGLGPAALRERLLATLNFLNLFGAAAQNGIEIPTIARWLTAPRSKGTASV